MRLIQVFNDDKPGKRNGDFLSIFFFFINNTRSYLKEEEKEEYIYNNGPSLNGHWDAFLIGEDD